MSPIAGENVIAAWTEAECEAVRAQVERIIASDLFSHGERQSQFLRYIVEASLGGSDDNLNQYAIGVDVYGRGSEFDPTTDSIVRVEAGRVRSKLTQYYAAEGLEGRVVISLPKGGYAASIQFNESAPISDDRVRSFMPRWVISAALVLGVLGTSFLVLNYVAPRADRNAVADAEVGSVHARAARAIAVLPFDNMSADPEQEYFSDGITEDIITDLSTLPGLTVIARNSTFVYKDRPTSIRTVAQELNVSHVLEGSVRREGDRVRITAQLIDVETEGHIWADRYDRSIEDVFEIQEDVSREIVSALELALPIEGQSEKTERSAPNVYAHDAWLRGKEQFYGFDKTGVLHSIELFSMAIDRDENFAEAYAWKSRALIFAFVSGFMTSKENTVDKALQLAEQAIEIDDTLPSAHANLAWAMRWNNELEEAGTVVARATKLDPNFADAFLWKSLILSSAGEGPEALNAIQSSNLLNPNYGATSIFALGRAHFALGNFDEAITAFNRGIDRNPDFLPNHTFKLFALEKKGDLDGAIVAKAMMAQINPDYERSASYLYYLKERN